MLDLAVFGTLAVILLGCFIWDARRSPNVRNVVWLLLILGLVFWTYGGKDRQLSPPTDTSRKVEELIIRTREEERKRAQPTTPVVDNGAWLTFEAFQRIKEGMGYRDVQDIMGKSGTLVATSSAEELPRVEAYEWSAGGRAVACTFENGKLVTKVQAGLR